MPKEVDDEMNICCINLPSFFFCLETKETKIQDLPEILLKVIKNV